MRILANENFPGPILRELRRRGHDVVWVKESMRGSSDREVLDKAQQEDRLVVTFDKDFGELAYRDRGSAPAGRACAAEGAGMIGMTRQVRVWAYGSPVDLRKGFDGLEISVRIRPLRRPFSPSGSYSDDSTPLVSLRSRSSR